MLINNNEALRKVCRRITAAKQIALDTEFVRVHSFFPKLSLVQISDGEITFAIDMMKEMDFAPLNEILLNESIQKNIHSARQDLEVLYNKFKNLPCNIFDTQIACQFLGFDAPPSYDGMIKHFLGIIVDKKHQFSDWLARPLAQEKLEYALDDVKYLAQVLDIIFSQLKKLGRFEWVQQESALLASINNFVSTPEELLNKFISHFTTPKQFSKALAIIKWREEQAIKRDVIRRKIISDDEIVLLVHKNILSKRLQRVITMEERDRLLNSAVDALDEEIVARVMKRKTFKKLEKNDKYYELLAMLNETSSREKISASLIATAHEILMFSHGINKEARFMHGWRYDLFGKAAAKC
jgi:ribonuclease D